MPLPWFRMYHEFATDPKVQMLSEVDQRRFVMLMCLKCCNGDVTLHETEVAFQLRVTVEELRETKARLMTKGLVDSDYQPVNWEKRQMPSDSSAARVSRHRKKQKRYSNVTPTVTETKCNAAEVEKDRDKDKDIKSGANRKRFIPPTLEHVKSRCTEMGYTLDPERFVNHYQANGWRVGRNPMKSWHSALANWQKGENERRQPVQRIGSGSTRDRPIEHDLNDTSWAKS